MPLPIRGAFIIIYKMNKDKQYPDEYKLTKSWMPKIAFFLILGCLVSMWCECSGQDNWLFLCFFTILWGWGLFYIIHNVEYAIFNHKGVFIVHTKRWGKNKTKQEFYIDWKDVKYIRFKTPLSKNSSPAIDITSSVFGRGYYHTTCLPYGKFASLAKYYSGREDIIYERNAFRKKRKMYEKDR